MNGIGMGHSDKPRDVYEPPRLEQLGEFHVETRNGCFFGKQWGGHDAFGAIIGGAPISNCSG